MARKNSSVRAGEEAHKALQGILASIKPRPDDDDVEVAEQQWLELSDGSVRENPEYVKKREAEKALKALQDSGAGSRVLER